MRSIRCPSTPRGSTEDHSKASILHTHNLSTHNCEVDGDVAHCETYVIVGLLDHGGQTARLISGRYIDRLERRNGEWKIALRRSIVDVAIAGDSSMIKYLGESWVTPTARGTRATRRMCGLWKSRLRARAGDEAMMRISSLRMLVGPAPGTRQRNVSERNGI